MLLQIHNVTSLTSTIRSHSSFKTLDINIYGQKEYNSPPNELLFTLNLFHNLEVELGTIELPNFPLPDEEEPLPAESISGPEFPDVDPEGR